MISARSGQHTMVKRSRRGRKRRGGETSAARSRRSAVDVRHVSLKLLLKRGALLAAANWPVIAIQFVATTTFQALLAVPLIGAAILVAVLLGADLAELLRDRSATSSRPSPARSWPSPSRSWPSSRPWRGAVRRIDSDVPRQGRNGGRGRRRASGRRSDRARADHHRHPEDGVGVHARAVYRRMRPALQTRIWRWA